MGSSYTVATYMTTESSTFYLVRVIRQLFATRVQSVCRGLRASFGFLFLWSTVQIIKRSCVALHIESSEDKHFFLISMVSEEVDQVDVAACWQV